MLLKHIIIFCILFLFSYSTILGQWFQQNSNTNRPLRTVFFVDINTGWAGGSNRTIIKTTDGGSNWDTLTTGTATGFVNSIFFINELTGWAACAYDSLLKTTDGGVSWITYRGSTYDDLLDVFFINPQTGWVVGFLGITRKSTNGGQTWSSYFSTIWSLNSVQFINELTGWVAGGGSRSVILRSTNGGINWVSQYDSSGMSFWRLQMDNQNIGWAIEGTQLGSHLFKTSNGGNNWFQVPVPISTGLKALFFANSQTGWAAGNAGKMIKSIDGGNNWTVQTTLSNFDFWQIFFINSMTGWGVGNPNIILKTTNGGEPIGITTISGEIPNGFDLIQNYPNPFNPSTYIRFDIPKESSVSIVIYDLSGREVSKLVNEDLKAGKYSVEWNATNFPSGVYLYQLTAGSERLTVYKSSRKMVLAR